MAIESVYVFENTSILADELFAHRLGLVPLKVDPRYFSFKADGEPARGIVGYFVFLFCKLAMPPLLSPSRPLPPLSLPLTTTPRSSAML